MINWLRQLFRPEMAPEGPVTFDFEEEIEASAEHIYRLLDLAHEPCAKRELGHGVEQLAPGTFRFTMWQMPDTPFSITVTSAEPHRKYAYRIEPDVKVGRLQWTQERYTLAMQDNGKCLVTLLVEAQFDMPMTMRDYSQEVARMAMGCAIALEKLRLHAEQGAEAVLDYEAEQFA
jgi:hypothetical protein